MLNIALHSSMVKSRCLFLKKKNHLDFTIGRRQIFLTELHTRITVSGKLLILLLIYIKGYGIRTTHTDPAGSSTGFSVPREKTGQGGAEGWM